MAPGKRKRRPKSTAQEPIESPPPIAKPLPVIKVVGISGSGKSTLTAALRNAGYDARPISQEHSNVADLWRQFGPTAYLIYLNASLEDQKARRQDVTWSVAAHHEEVRRLAHAYEHADVRIDTADLDPAGVFSVAKSYLVRRRVRRADHPLEALPATGSSKRPIPPNSEP